MRNLPAGDGDHGTNMTSRSSDAVKDGTVKLEGSRSLVVFLRAESRRIMKIRVVSDDCTVDAGGLPLVWLSGVKPAESVAMLARICARRGFRRARRSRRVGEGALTAIALHADESADRALESFVRPEERESLRKQAAFWLGEARGKAGLLALQKMAKSDPSADVRAHVTFALSVSREPAALDEMIRMAKEDESGHVRGQALFWLAQKAGKKAVGTITGAIENDPDTDVKKKAVFALSQLPKDEGVPKLIEVAQSESQSRGAQTSHVLAGPIERSARARVFREDLVAVGTSAQLSAAGLRVERAHPSSSRDTSRSPRLAATGRASCRADAIPRGSPERRWLLRE